MSDDPQDDETTDDKGDTSEPVADSTPPDTFIDNGPLGSMGVTVATFAFTCSEPPCTFACRLDGGAWNACTSPRDLARLTVAVHSFDVRAADLADNTDPTPATRTWTVADATAPQTFIDSGPTGTVAVTTATFTFSCSEAACTYDCRLDGGAWAPCTSPRALTGMSETGHTFEVRATDLAGNPDATPADRTWTVQLPPYALTLRFERIPQTGLDDVRVVATLSQGGEPRPGKTLTLTVPRGAPSAVTDAGDGTYAFTISPAGTGIYPVTIAYGGASITRKALVLTTVAEGLGQPMLVPGLVNTDGYEDGISITPDGQYLFIQYGPVYFSGIFNHASICAEAGWSMYNLTTCPGKTDADWIFNTIGPYGTSDRPLFPDGGIRDGQLMHIGITVPTVASRIVLFPTVFYGFKRQADGTFAEPFKVAFNDSRGVNGPFGISFQMIDATHARVLFAWDNYFNNLGDDKPDIYHGVITMGTTNNLGDVAFSGEFFASITPNVTPVGFSSHLGVQGNPHLYYDGANDIRSIWTDDEQISHDVSVYRLTGGAFPDGVWTPTTLPAKISTVASESQPFFTGSHLIVNRDVRIEAHAFTGTGESEYNLDAAWGDAVTLLASGDPALDGIYGIGEPTIAKFGGKTYLYFAYVENREIRVSGRYDFDLGAAFVEIPAGYTP